MTTEITFSSKEVASIIGISYRQLDFLIRQGYFEPMVQAKGTGTRRGFSSDDIKLLLFADEFGSAGLGVRAAFRKVDQYREELLAAKNEFLVLDRSGITLISNDSDGINKLHHEMGKNRLPFQIVLCSNVADRQILALEQLQAARTQALRGLER